MTPWFAGRRFWLVDVLDAYSRYLVHPGLTGRAGCEALLTARADVLQLAVQRGLETLDGRLRIPGEPEIVHDRGPKFLAREWRAFVHAVAEGTDVTTRGHHPQSNGRDERIHRAFREEFRKTPTTSCIGFGS